MFPVTRIGIVFVATILLGFTPVHLTAGVNVTWKRHVIDPEFRAEACAAMDVDGDGRLDIIAGENIYEAPDFKPRKFRDVAIQGGYADVRIDVPLDVNRDGRADLITVHRDQRMEWLENPGKPDHPWKTHPIGDALKTEGVIAADIDGDGRADLVGPTDPHGAGVAWWGAADRPDQAWRKTLLGPAGGDAHGQGAGDLNRDGRTDVLTRFGWYEAPADPTQPGWAFHNHILGEVHQPVVYDFDGDGDQDIAAARPHDFGLYGWAAGVGEDGKPRWTRHLIDDSISQLHALEVVDVDGDGDRDLITGKRFHAHNGRDPGADMPAHLVWYELRRDGRDARFERHIIDDDSGVGYFVTPVDIDADGDLDVLTANKKGVFLFEQAGRPRLLPLFDGKTLDSFIGNRDVWSVESGTLVGRTKTGLEHNDFLVSRDTYGDFVMTLQVRLVPDSANSGIQFRSTPRDDGEVEGYQADIGHGWWGSIYEELGRALLNDGYKQRGAKAVVPGAWNDYVIYAVGDELRVEINGTVCTHLRDAERKEGVIAFQVHSGGPTEVSFRNIRLRAIER